MAASTETTIVVVAAAVAVAPILADSVRRWIAIPNVVVELILGILIGPVALGWASDTTVVAAIADFGLAVLMFLAGYEIDFQRIAGSPLRRAIAGWGISLVIGLLAGIAIRGASLGGLVLGLALTTTALGSILPILGDAGVLATPFGARIMAIGALGEFGPIVAVALLLTSDQPLKTSLLLGAFAAGIIEQLAVRTADSGQREIIRSKLEAIGYGAVVPFFFVVSGVKLDISAFGHDPAALILIPVALILFLLVRGGPVPFLYRHDLTRNETIALTLLSGTALPLVVVITTIGTEAGVMKASVAAALVCAGMLSVLIFPLTALNLLPATSARELLLFFAGSPVFSGDIRGRVTLATTTSTGRKKLPEPGPTRSGSSGLQVWARTAAQLDVHY